MLKLIATTLLALSLLAAPAAADVPSSVHAGRHGVVDGGWVRAACAVADDGARCSVRFPRPSRFVVVTYALGGIEYGRDWIRVEHAAPSPHAFEVLPRTHIVAGITLDCLQAGSVTECSLDMPPRFSDQNVNYYGSGRFIFGQAGRDLELS